MGPWSEYIERSCNMNELARQGGTKLIPFHKERIRMPFESFFSRNLKMYKPQQGEMTL